MLDVAHLAGVSQTTVSFIIAGRADGDDRISDETRARVMQAIAQLGYVPNQAARTLRKQRTERIALFIDRLGVPFFDSLAQSLHAAAEARGFSLILLMGKSYAQQRRMVESIYQGVADAVFFANPRFVEDEDLARMARAGIAAAVYDNALQAGGVDFVRYPAFDVSQAEVEYLVRKGHRRIGFIGIRPKTELSDLRCAGYVAAMQGHGLLPQFIMVEFENWLSRGVIYDQVTALLRQPDRPTAILLGSDFGAIVALAAAQDAGLRVPQDLAVMGSGNIPEASYIRPSLSTVGPDPLDFSPAVDMLFSRLAGEAPAEGRTWMMEWKLLERQST